MIIKRKLPDRISAKNRKIENKKGEETVYLYDYIGGFWGIDTEQWVKDFNEIDVQTIHLRIDSGGGDIFAARAMQTAIKQHKATVIAHIDGLAASAASFLAMGADEIEIVDGGFLMIHKGVTLFDIFGFFNTDDLDTLTADIAHEIELLHKVDDAIATDYVKKTEKDIKTMNQWMTDETWFTAKEALENGFVDRIYDGEPVENKYDLSIYANVPDELKNIKKDLNERDLDRALRDAGCSRSRAKEILAKGFKGDPNEREAQEEARLKAEREAQIAEETHLREAEEAKKVKEGSTEDLLMQAEIMAPTK